MTDDDLEEQGPTAAPAASTPSADLSAPLSAAAKVANVAGFAVRGLSRSRGTYEVKDELKAIGCVWDSVRRAWIAPSVVVHDEAMRIVARGPIPQALPGGKAASAPPDIRAYGSDQLRAELLRRGVLLSGVPTAQLQEEALRRGLRVIEDGPAMLGELLGPAAPTLDELSGALDKLEGHYASADETPQEDDYQW